MSLVALGDARASADEPPVSLGPEDFPASRQNGEWGELRSAISAAQPVAALKDKKGIPLADGTLRELIRAQEAGIQGPFERVSLASNSVRVEILHASESGAMEAIVSSLGGSVYGAVPGHLSEAVVPIDQLIALEEHPDVRSVRPPLRANVPIEPSVGSGTIAPSDGLIVGQEIGKTNADAWHAAGITGEGVRVGVIDVFDGAAWNAAQTAGELPAPSGTFCRFLGQNCDLFAGQSSHGVAVSEIIHEMAWDAEIYIATAITNADTQAAVDYFASQGVDIISRSLTAEYDGPGDGTGPLATIIDDAASQGMVWLNSAGNNSGSDAFPGSYWRGGWNDSDADGWLNFSGAFETVPFLCGFLNGLRWSDWQPSGRTDYDLVIFDDESATIIKAVGEDDQTSGAEPLEHVQLPCSDPLDIDQLAIAVFNPGSGTGGDILEVMGNQVAFLDYWQNAYSASGPASDSFNAGMISVGAIDPPLGTTNAFYSSQGPTNDGRTKPDLSAAACVSSFSVQPCFNGTSSATPAVAGAAALVLSSGVVNGSSVGSEGVVNDPAALATYLKGSTVNRGAPGPDNIYGVGELILGDPPNVQTPSPTPTPTAPASQTPTQTPTAAPSSSITATPTPSGTPTATATPTPTPTTEPGQQRVWADGNCSGTVEPVDALVYLRHDANLNVNQPSGCPELEEAVLVQGNELAWGDTDCDGSVGPIDALRVLRHDANLRVDPVFPCPDVGQTGIVS